MLICNMNRSTLRAPIVFVCEGQGVQGQVVVQGDHGENSGGQGMCTSGARGLCMYVCVLSCEAAR